MTYFYTKPQLDALKAASIALTTAGVGSGDLFAYEGVLEARAFAVEHNAELTEPGDEPLTTEAEFESLTELNTREVWEQFQDYVDRGRAVIIAFKTHAPEEL